MRTILAIFMMALWFQGTVWSQAGIKVGFIADMAWSPDGTRMAVAVGPGHCDDQSDMHKIEIRDAVTQDVLQTLQGHTCSILSVAWHPDGTELASAGMGPQDSTIRIWDLTSGQVRLIYKPTVTLGRFSAAWSPDGSKLANLYEMGESIEVWDAGTGERLGLLTGHTHPLNAVAWSPDGSYLASASSDHTVRIWDVTGGETITILNGHTSSVDAVSWSPDGTQVVSSGGDATVRVWDVATGQLLHTLAGGEAPVFVVRWSPDGSKIGGGDLDGAIRIWRTDTMQEITNLQTELGPILDVEWHPDSTWLGYIGRDSTDEVQMVSIDECLE